MDNREGGNQPSRSEDSVFFLVVFILSYELTHFINYSGVDFLSKLEKHIQTGRLFKKLNFYLLLLALWKASQNVMGQTEWPSIDSVLQPRLEIEETCRHCQYTSIATWKESKVLSPEERH